MFFLFVKRSTTIPQIGYVNGHVNMDIKSPPKLLKHYGAVTLEKIVNRIGSFMDSCIINPFIKKTLESHHQRGR
jgi:hypothetical protein